MSDRAACSLLTGGCGDDRGLHGECSRSSVRQHAGGLGTPFDVINAHWAGGLVRLVGDDCPAQQRGVPFLGDSEVLRLLGSRVACEGMGLEVTDDDQLHGGHITGTSRFSTIEGE